MGTFKKFVVGEMILRYVSGIALQTLRHKKPEWFRTETDRKIVHLSLEIEAINRDIVSLINYHDRSNELFEDRIRSTRDYWNKELTEVKKSVTNRNYAAKSINDIVANQRSLRDEQVKITKWQSQIVERLEMLEGKMK